MNKNKKEFICYLFIFILLVFLVVMNNLFWKLGKQDNNKDNSIYLESNNVIYDVPYNEKVLD